ncbi:hypothetical protein K1719_023695 [Acacia pycnantha]|nr:hypothetical protein K1719_023695 [Acacia pycnantha]
MKKARRCNQRKKDKTFQEANEEAKYVTKASVINATMKKRRKRTNVGDAYSNNLYIYTTVGVCGDDRVSRRSGCLILWLWLNLVENKSMT